MPNNISFANWRTVRFVKCWSRWIWLSTPSWESDRKGHRKRPEEAPEELKSRACSVVWPLWTSVQVQQRKSAIHGLLVTLCRVKSDKSDWFWSQSIVFTNEGLLGGFSHPLSLKFRGQLSLIPKITETVIPKTSYLWNLTIGSNFTV